MFLFRSFRPLVLLLVVSLCGGCSLLTVELDSQTTPLSEQELSMRMLTREYSKEFFTKVENSADAMAASYPEDDVLHQSYLLLWKIHAEQGLQQATYQTIAPAAFIDSWVFTIQMEQFFTQGAGKSLFDDTSAAQTATELRSDFEQLAQSLLNKSNYASQRQFAEAFATQHPFTTIAFSNTPAYRSWLNHQGIAATDSNASMGTMPEALADVSDRLSLMSEQSGKIMGWKAELIRLNSNIDGNDLRATLDSIQNSADSLQQFVARNPEPMRDLAQKMTTELQPLLDDLDRKTDAKLVQLSAERQALDAMVARERDELIKMVAYERQQIAQIVSHERAQFAQELDQISQNAVTVAVEKVIDLLKGTILFVIAFILMVFFAPLALGYRLGKRAQK